MKGIIGWMCLIGMIYVNNLHAQQWIMQTLPPFHSMEVSGSLDLILSQGNSYSYSATESDFSALQLEVVNGVLQISNNKRGLMNLLGPSGTIFITVDQLKNISLGGACDLKGGSLMFFDSLNIRISGGADLNMELEAKYLNIHSSGGSDVKLRGTVQELVARSSGGSDIHARQLRVNHADLRASGGSDIKVYVKETLKASASGGADIYYYGNPLISYQKSSGSADIRQQ